MPIAVWDAVGTLLDLQPVRERFAALGAPQGLDVWFERIVHTGAALTLAGEFRPFADVASSTLPTVLAQLGLPHEERRPIDALKNELGPYVDAAQALDTSTTPASIHGSSRTAAATAPRERWRAAVSRGGSAASSRSTTSVCGSRIARRMTKAYDARM
jgi:hypothetical protein